MYILFNIILHIGIFQTIDLTKSKILPVSPFPGEDYTSPWNKPYFFPFRSPEIGPTLIENKENGMNMSE